MIETLQGVVLAHAAFVVPVGIWILKGFFDTIPAEMREAALVDGCTELGILWRIVLPLSAPAVVTVAVIGFFDGWNEYLFASTFLTSKHLWVTVLELEAGMFVPGVGSLNVERAFVVSDRGCRPLLRQDRERPFQVGQSG